MQMCNVHIYRAQEMSQVERKPSQMNTCQVISRFIYDLITVDIGKEAIVNSKCHGFMSLIELQVLLSHSALVRHEIRDMDVMILKPDSFIVAHES